MSEITISDPRVQDVAQELDMSPEEVLDTAEMAASLQEITLDEELDLVEGNVHAVDFEDEADEDNYGDGPNDTDEDGDISGWSEEDVFPC